MLEWLSEIVGEFGLLGLFVSSFLGSTIFIPFTVELTFPILVSASVSKISIALIASAGSLCGTLINFGVGYQGMNLVKKYVKDVELERARHLMNHYGWLGLFTVLALPIPLPVDPLTIIAGIARMKVWEFTLVVFSAKLLKYGFILGIVSLVF
jgi:membrane protein YqaA with SNARE-associated domain